jgi:hypothetical protein
LELLLEMNQQVVVVVFREEDHRIEVTVVEAVV